ncbi:MAG: FtsX-like permease family protein [Epsilonproteobacteria bacterium]|nr:FtsX-like permease family protein [Campylobacterota bacterium]
MIEFAISSLKRRFWKYLAVFFIYTLLIWLTSSIFLISLSLKKELFLTVEELPEIIVQKTLAGRLIPIEIDRVEKIEEIVGVEAAYPRVWGYYYFAPARVNFSVVGLEEIGYTKTLNNFLALNEFEGNVMVVGEGVKRILNNYYYKEFFNFITPSGEFVQVKLKGTFPTTSALESSDTILLPLPLARKIFQLPSHLATDIVVKVPNPKEVPLISQKIKTLFPDSRVISKEDIKASYQNLFDYKQGVFLAVMLGAFLAFFILAFERISAIGQEEMKEIGILKALGWQIRDILKLKFLEALLVVGNAFFIGIVLSYGYVFWFQAPLLRNLFSGFSVLKPTVEFLPVWDWGVFITLFLVTVPLYLFAVIIPSWRASVVDPEEILR